MPADTLFYLALLLLLAALLRNEAILLALYLLLGALLLGRWWSSLSLKGLAFQRRFDRRAFIGEKVAVRLELHNRSRLPAVWLRIQDALPVELSSGVSYRRVLSLAPDGRFRGEYLLHPSKRGAYDVGPFSAGAGDLFGFAAPQQRTGDEPGWQAETLIVYPRVYPVGSLLLPSRSPLGSLRSQQPLYEDPTRVRAKRPYVAGDSLRRVDWKTSAATGKLQVKQYEPSIALESMILLNLYRPDYDLRAVYDISELAIALAASLAHHLSGQKQPVGLALNQTSLPPRKGQAALMRLLETLALVQMSATGVPYLDLLSRQRVNLPWGATALLLTPRLDDRLLEEIFQYRRSGLSVMLFLVGNGAGGFNPQRAAALARSFHLPFYHFLHEADLHDLQAPALAGKVRR